MVGESLWIYSTRHILVLSSSANGNHIKEEQVPWCSNCGFLEVGWQLEVVRTLSLILSRVRTVKCTVWSVKVEKVITLEDLDGDSILS
jgi:hypothetical protein